MDKSPLAKLSPELRNLVYAYYFDTHEIDIQQEQPALTRTCKQIRIESLELSYHLRDGFKITIAQGNFKPSVIDWASSQDSANLRSIKKLTISTDLVSCHMRYHDRWMEAGVALVYAGIPHRLTLLVPETEGIDLDAEIAKVTSTPTVEGAHALLATVENVTQAVQFKHIFYDMIEAAIEEMAKRESGGRESELDKNDGVAEDLGG